MKTIRKKVCDLQVGDVVCGFTVNETIASINVHDSKDCHNKKEATFTVESNDKEYTFEEDTVLRVKEP